MEELKKEIERYELKMKKCSSMTDLLLAMSAWQAFCERNGLTQELRRSVDEAYIKAESRLIPQVKKSLW